MKIYAQHGFGAGQRVINGLAEGTIDGVIFSARYLKRESAMFSIEEIHKQSPDADILLDPEFYACLYADTPNAQLRHLNSWKSWNPCRRNELETTESIEDILKKTFQELLRFPLTAIIAPNIYIPKSFDSIEAVIAKNFIRKTRPIFTKFQQKRPIYATLAIGCDALKNLSEFKDFLNDITAISNPPDGFYILIGGGITEEKTDITRSEIIHADVIGGWMLLNYTLSLNEFTIINGYSDILTPFLVGSGGYAGATGWWNNLRSFSMSRYVSKTSGGQLPIIRYLSNRLLNRVKFDEREAFSNILPEIDNGLPHDKDYKKGEIDRVVEILQTWEAIAQLNKQVIVSDIHDTLKRLEIALTNAQVAYGRLSHSGFSIDVGVSNYINTLREGISTFKKNAEI